MDEDNVIYEMFLELTAKLDVNDPDGRMRILSQNPRHAEDDEPTTAKSITHKR
jgi:phage repressor protein C with HTH and peptisase S24 domain